MCVSYSLFWSVFVSRFVVISGCSGGGKSTLLAALAAQGYAVVPEPGRRIVDEALQGGPGPLPWEDLTGFLQRAWALALADREAAAQHEGWVFFDRGLVDAAVGLAHQTGGCIQQWLGEEHRYHHQVFLTPPWPAIYVADDARRHGLDAAQAEYARLVAAYTALGYALTILPLVDVNTRVEQVLHTLGPCPETA